MPSYPLDDLFAEQPLRPEQQHDQRQHKGKPRLGIAPQQRLTPVDLEQLFQNPDHQPADDRARDTLQPAQHQHRQRLVGDHLKRETHARPRPQAMPVTSAMIPAMNQTSTQIVCSEMPTDSAAWWSSPSARIARPIRVLVQEHQQRHHQQRRHHHHRDVLLLRISRNPPNGFQNPATQSGMPSSRGDHHLVLAAKDDLADADQEQRDPDGRHEQDDVGLAHQRAQARPARS